VPKLKLEPKTSLRSKPKVEANGTYVILTAEDRTNATAAARRSNPTLADWISSMALTRLFSREYRPAMSKFDHTANRC
jgi:hypothetical protein